MNIKKYQDYNVLVGAKDRISKVVLKMRETDYNPDLGSRKGNVSHCLSKQLIAHKGSYAVIAGVFNYWTFESVSEFVKELSKEFQTEIMLMSWDEERDIIQCQIYLAGKPLFEVNENPIGAVIRKVC